MLMNVDIKSFNDLEDTTIYWVGGFIKKYGNRRPKVRVYTNTKGFVWYYDVALGRLPWMYLGARYKQGQFTEVGGSGSVHFTIQNMSDIDFISFDKVPFELRRQRKNPDLVKELVCRYSQNGNTYYIPQMEFIRSFFGMNNTVLNYLLMPSGVDSLCKIENIENDDVEIAFTDRFPRNLLNVYTASLIGSVILEPELMNFWSSVYESYRTNSSQLFIPPQLNDVALNCSGIWDGSSYLIYKINRIQNIPKPFENVFFSHPSDTSEDDEEDDLKDRTIIVPEKEKGGYEVTDDDYAKDETNKFTMSYESAKTAFSFDRKVRGERKKSNVSKRYKTEVRKDKDKTTDDNRLSTGLSVSDGDVKSANIDNAYLYETYGKNICGLEEFLKAIESLRLKVDVVDVHIGSLFGDKKFVMLDDNIRRSYALVVLQKAFIIEVARPDDHSISTLILKSISETHLKAYFRELLRNMINNGGHWDFEFLDNHFSGKYLISKHMQFDTPLKWANRLLSKVL